MKRPIERFLYGQGFSSPILREIMLAQFAVSGLALLAGALLAALYALGVTGAAHCIFMFSFFAGAALVTVNFWLLSLFIFKHFHSGYSRQFLVGQLLRFLGRFIFCGAMLGLIILNGGSVLGVSLGLGSALVVITALTLFRCKLSGGKNGQRT